MVMKHAYGPDMIRRFLKYELDRYLRARGGDVLPEQPLERVEDQPYIYYRKGSLVMYRLQDEIGEDRVNGALRRLLRLYAFRGPALPDDGGPRHRAPLGGAGRQAAADHRPVREDHPLRHQDHPARSPAAAPTAATTSP